MQNNNILRIKKLIEIPYMYNNHDLAIKGASASANNHNMNIKPIRLKQLKNYEALNGLASMIGNSNNNSIKGASISSMQKPNYNHLKLDLKSNPIINYVNRMNQKVVSPCKNKNGIKGASSISNSEQNKEQNILALRGLSAICQV